MKATLVDHVESPAGAPAPEEDVTVLAVGDSEDDHGWLAKILRHSRWKMLSVRSCREAFEVLRSSRIPVVLCECALSNGSWKSLLNRFAQSAEGPLLVVTSRLADERLWAEVLSLGGYDVLSKPFDPAEVVRVIGAAVKRVTSNRGNAAQLPQVSAA